MTSESSYLPAEKRKEMAQVLAKQHDAYLRNLIRRFSSDQHAVDDIAQEVASVVLNRAPVWLTEDKLPQYISTVARSQAAQWYRDKARQIDEIDIDGLTSGSTATATGVVDPGFEMVEAIVDVETALNENEQRLVHADLNDVSDETLRNRLGWSQYRLRRARKKMHDRAQVLLAVVMALIAAALFALIALAGDGSPNSDPIEDPTPSPRSSLVEPRPATTTTASSTIEETAPETIAIPLTDIEPSASEPEFDAGRVGYGFVDLDGVEYDPALFCAPTINYGRSTAFSEITLPVPEGATTFTGIAGYSDNSPDLADRVVTMTISASDGTVLFEDSFQAYDVSSVDLDLTGVDQVTVRCAADTRQWRTDGGATDSWVGLDGRFE